MKRLKTNPKSSKKNRIGWAESLPPKDYRIFVDRAIKVCGSAVALAKILGITRSAVYQWRAPYRFDPYMPEKAARKLIDENPELRSELLKHS